MKNRHLKKAALGPSDHYRKAKNENRAKYAQRFLKQFADKYGADVAVRVAEIVLKD